MKIISWNIGNFIYLKHLPGRQHYAFQIKDIEKVTKIIKKGNADVIFLQEIMSEDVDFVFSNFPEYDYKMIVRNDYRESVSLFLSKYTIQEVSHTNSSDYIINSITFFPIHLDAFSPSRRYNQVNLLLPDLPNKMGIILGDANFWILDNKYIKSFSKILFNILKLSDIFFSSRDKKSYNKILIDHTDVLNNMGSTCRMFLSLDKIFITKDLKSKNTKITKHKIGHIDHYMISTEIDL